ncbi:hypothetical protein TTRE_0000394301 [Trichuris trichiura]|uniref:Uncharacterized protein n=1 Tax=Trichuris trichiura TaxID=36087 RepID=A0A077ZAH4_TRITR|nr:hypothetical protein TTRE_0000394301 [Trichuris trichiura]
MWPVEWKDFEDQRTSSSKKKRRSSRRRSVIQGNLDVLAGVADFQESITLPSITYATDPTGSDSLSGKKKKKKSKKSKDKKKKDIRLRRQSVEEGNISVLIGNPKFTALHAGMDSDLACRIEKMDSKKRKQKAIDSEQISWWNRPKGRLALVITLCLLVGTATALAVGFILNHTLQP